MPKTHPDQLLAHLIENEELISYKAAYEALIGPIQGPWRNRVHPPQITLLALRTRPAQVGGLTIQLDSLIVNKNERVPSKGHFKSKPNYTEDQWFRTFKRWPLCSHYT